MDWIYTAAKPVCLDSQQQALTHQSILTKPPGSLGRLEELAVQLAGLQATASPDIKYPFICIFAADHGVAVEGVSAFPQEVTQQMLINFANGGAAISVLANELQAKLTIVNMGIASTLTMASAITDLSINNGTKNFCEQPAMSETELNQALLAGKSIIDSVDADEIDLFIGGEMGIANTTSASALACAILNKPATELVGLGTGVDKDGLQRKINAVEKALQLHADALSTPESCLSHLGGFEIAALVGAYIRCAQLGISILVDGFICSVAALLASKINNSIIPWLLFSHESAESGHKLILTAVDAKPILSLDMRLGEASGAAMAIPVIKLACALHNNMATFAEAGVTDQ